MGSGWLQWQCTFTVQRPIVKENGEANGIGLSRMPRIKWIKMKRSTADKWFSVYIRLRDSHDGWCQCITCSRIFWWTDGDCGHFVTRNHPMTRFSEANCHAQCKACNNYKKGEQYLHGRAIDDKCGDGAADYLVALGRVRGQRVHGKLCLADIAKEYRIKAKKMANEKGVEI
jgi:hypothetical protein